jgi:hypothetical protein
LVQPDFGKEQAPLRGLRYERRIRVPAIVRWRSKWSSGMVTREMLAAVPATPGWSLPMQDYHYSGDASDSARLANIGIGHAAIREHLGDLDFSRS